MKIHLCCSIPFVFDRVFLEQEGMGRTACTLCGRGTFSSATGASSASTCLTCDIGKYSQLRGANSSGACTPCPPGRYFVSADAECPVCPVGTFSAQERSLACTDCSAGTYADEAGSTTCTLCPAGTSSASSKASSPATCARCAAGTIASQAGTTACTTCGTGSYEDGNRTSCTLCGAGTYSNATGAFSASTCRICSPGTFSSGSGASRCTECALGTYVRTSGATACRTCPSGRMTAAVGTADRNDCLAYYSYSTCAAGYYYSSAVGGCLGCPRGTYSAAAGATSAETCLPCPKGLFMPRSGASACMSCIPGAYVPPTIAGGATYCVHDIEGTDRPLVPCPAAGYYPVNATHCKACPPGTFLDGTACSVCPAQTYATGYGNTKCTPCYTGSYSGMVVPSYAPDPGSPGCSLMPPSVGKPDMRRGRPFPPTSIVSLPREYVPSYYQWTRNIPQYVMDGLRIVTDASGNRIIAGIKTFRLTLPSWRVNVSGMPYGNGAYNFVSVNDSDVDENNIVSVFDGTSAYWTSTKRYSDWDREYIWAIIQNGNAVLQKAWQNGQWIEINVPQAIRMTRYRIVGRWPAPSSWNDGVLSNQWSIYGSTDGAMWDLVSLTGMNDYLNFYFQWQDGIFPYFDIWYELSSDFYTNPLTKNYYTRFRLEMQRLTYPLALDEWQIFGIGSCDPGMYWSDEISNCTLCDVGTYKPVDGGEYCTPCPSGTFSAIKGATTCAMCASGTSSSSAGGQTSCSLCAAGTYWMNSSSVDSNDHVLATGICQPCAPGTFSSAPGSLQCTPCAPGAFANNNGSAACIPCAGGTYAASATGCVPCSIGKYADSGSSACTNCAPGSYANANGTAACTLCAPGTYSSQAGAGFYTVVPPPSAESVVLSRCAGDAYQCSTATYSGLWCILSPYARMLPPTPLLDASSSGYVVTASSDPLVSGYDAPYRAFGAYDTGVKWDPSSFRLGNYDSGYYSGSSYLNANEVRGVWIALQLPKPEAVRRATFLVSSSYLSGTPWVFFFYARNTTALPQSTAWTSIYAPDYASYKSIPGTSYSMYDSGCFSNAAAYDTYAILIYRSSSPYGGDASKMLKIAQLRYYAYDPPTNLQPNITSYACSACPSGTFAKNAGSSACATCEAGTYLRTLSDGATKVCEPCMAGTYYQSSTQTCIPCPAGTFSTVMGAPDWTACQPCPPGEYSPLPGAVSCNKCSAGQRTR